MKPTERTYSWDVVPALAGGRIETGENALSRIDANVEMLVHDWHAVGIALGDMQAEAMRQAGANRPIGKGYNAAWAVLAYHAPRLAKLDKATRSHAAWLAEHWDVVEEWHANLPTELRRMINHPATVHRRFDRDHPMPRKAGAPKHGFEPDDDLDADAAEADDDNNTEDAAGAGEVFDIGDRPSAPAPETREDWLRAVDAAWSDLASVLRRGPPQWRAAPAQQILWDLGDLANQGDEDDETAEVVDDIDREIAAHESREVRAEARAIASTPSHGEPTLERLAMVVEEALAKLVAEGEDIFAGLGDEGGQRPVTPALVLAKRPGLTKGQAKIIAAKINHPDWGDEALAEETKLAASTVRRVLDANGYPRQ